MLQSLHNKIDRLRVGEDRSCDDCKKIYETIYFPYKSVNLCIYCYESSRGVILRKHRQKINKKILLW